MSFALKTIYSPSPATTRGKPVVLGGDPKGNNFLYTCGNAVIIRNIKNPNQADIYYEHAQPATVAKYAPSGFYIASGDLSGTLRIWDTTQLEHPLKIELKVLSGPIADIAWSADSQRLVVVGDGKERFGAAILWDSGASVGEITGHSKAIASCDFKATRPFRVITGAEDFQANWFEGPPFKFKHAFKEHTRFLTCVRFSPDGEKVLTVGLDKKGFILDGKTGEKVGALAGGADAHALGIYSCSWSPDSKKVLTVSADKSAKIWDDKGTLLTTFAFEGGVESQLLGSLWQGDTLLAVNLNGDIFSLDQNNPKTPARTLKGHNKLVTSLAFDTASKALYSGSYDGVILQWNLETGIAVPIAGTGHTSSVTQAVVQGNKLVSVSVDDTTRFTPLNPPQYAAQGAKLDSQPQSVAVAQGKDIAVVVTLNSVVVLQGEKVASTTAVKYQPTVVRVSVDGSEVAVGAKDNSIHIYSLSGTTLSEQAVLSGHRGFLTAIAYSPDGKHFASADQNRDIFVWDKASRKIKVEGWVYHNARVTSLAWNSNSNNIVTGSLDSHVYVWSVSEPSKHIAIKNAHRGGVNAVLWVDEHTVASAGLDCSIKTWTIKN
uniref:66 kDa stress protein n=1 Tax=Physarum polycephalum TaxID=5791 RepID=WD66_PHYPO|nr:RecName: Full=66 kDa stress protein; AltName: Full=p66 [Physarum polycephalum]AAC26321.1 66-kDa stress protein p66 [Physarum polycephalum]